jgi:AcrR family transcriptional regulator
MENKTIKTNTTREKLMEAFWQLYSKKRIESITIKEITQIAGYNRGTFYEYFLDVYDILEKIEDKIIPDIKDLPPTEAPTTYQQDSLNEIITFYQSNASYLTILLSDKGDPAFLNKLKNHIKPKIKSELINKGVVDGFELDYALEYSLQGLLGVLNHWFLNNDNNEPLDKLVMLMYELMNQGPMNYLIKKC